MKSIFKIHNYAWYIFTKRDLIIVLTLLITGYIFGEWGGVILVLILNTCLLAFMGYVRSGQNARKIDIILKRLMEKKIMRKQEAIFASEGEESLKI